MMPPRIDITRTQIEQVVAVFYTRVRDDAVLGPIFAVHINHWPEHEAKITRFWASAIWFEGSYDGNPMRAYMQAGNVHSTHFQNWLTLFDEVLQTEIATPYRDQWSALVHRIARGLSFGLVEAERPSGAVPVL